MRVPRSDARRARSAELAVALLVLLARTAWAGIIAADLVAEPLERLGLGLRLVRQSERLDVDRLLGHGRAKLGVLRAGQLGATLAFFLDALLGELRLFLRLDAHVHQDADDVGAHAIEQRAE